MKRVGSPMQSSSGRRVILPPATTFLHINRALDIFGAIIVAWNEKETLYWSMNLKSAKKYWKLLKVSHLLFKAYIIWPYFSFVDELFVVFWFDDNSLALTTCPLSSNLARFICTDCKSSIIFWFDSFTTLRFACSSVLNSPVLSALVSTKLSIILWLDDNSLGAACPSAVKSPVLSVPVDKLSVFSWFDGFSLGSMNSSSMTFPECSALVGRLNPPLQ